MTKISIIIPLYNGEKYIERCINSILDQHVNDIEVIVINDASKDNSLNIVKEMKAKDSRIILLDKEKNEGPMVARSEGVDMAIGDYCFFCDCDDWLPKNSLPDLYEKAQEAGSDIVIGDICRINSKGQTHLLHRNRYSKQYLAAIYSGVICSMCGLLFKTSFIRQVNLPALKGLKMSEDRLLLTQILLLNPRISGIPRNTYFYYSNEESSTNKRLSDKAFILQIMTLKQCYELVLGENLINDVVEKWFARYILYYIEQGYPLKKYFSHDTRIQPILSFAYFRKKCGVKLAFHLILCLESKTYRSLSQTGRRIIRRIQHKY